MQTTHEETAAKCALAACVDSFHQCPSGEIGQSLCEEVQMDKLLEPAPVKQVMALPRPDDMPRKRRDR